MVNIDPHLPRITRPGRYTGGEWNSVRKDWETSPVRLALIYPDVYEIGMSNLGLTILYDLVNRDPRFLAERAFAPWTDMEELLRQEGLPLFSLESRRPLGDFDLLGFSLGYELTYTNVLTILDLAGIPLRVEERGGQHPLVMAGGSCALNPEPMSDFVDFFVLGEGEEVLLEVLAVVNDAKASGVGDREAVLRALAQVPGVYVPRFYQVDYHPDGTVAAVTPTEPGLPRQMVRRIIEKLPPPVTRPVVPYVQTVHDRAAIEIQRGCTRGCRFCQAGVIYRPLRQRPVAEVLAAAEELLANTGYDELALVSLSTSDHPDIEKLVRRLSEGFAEAPLSLSLPSLRLDSFSVGLAEAVSGRKKTGFTFAPEAGSQRLRQIINKGLSEEDLLRTAELVFSKGWSSLKLYFMLGLPTETMEDVEAIVDLAHRVRRLGRAFHNGRLRITVNVSTFIPKAHTPFQWLGQATAEELDAKQQVLRAGIRRGGFSLSWQDPETSLLEAVLARGDRRLGRVIHRAWELGSRFDSWSDKLRIDAWQQAFSECGLDPSFYAHRQRPLDEVFPWSHISSGVSPAFLRREYQRAISGRETPDCRGSDCAICGLQETLPQCVQKYSSAFGGLAASRASEV